jgi:hypothetical protein
MLRVLVALVMLAGCEEPATQVLVWVDVPDGTEMRARATRLAVRAFDRDDAMVFEDTIEIGTAGVLPVSISVVPRDNDGSYGFRVDVALVETDGMGADVEFARQTAEASFVASTTRAST